jgi:hypothetical protein
MLRPDPSAAPVLFSCVLGKLSRRAHRTVAAAAHRESQQISASLGTDLGDMPRPLDTTLITVPTVRWRANQKSRASLILFLTRQKAAAQTGRQNRLYESTPKAKL